MKDNNPYTSIESDMGDPNMEWEDSTVCADCKFRPIRPYAFLCTKYDNIKDMNRAIIADKCFYYERK